MDDALEEERLSVFVEMNVAELDYAIAVERCWQIRNGDGPLDDVDLVTGDFAGVESQTGGGGTCSQDEVSAGQA